MSSKKNAPDSTVAIILLTRTAVALLGETQLLPDSNAATISDIVLEDGHTLEYRIECDEGALAEIEKIVITRQYAA